MDELGIKIISILKELRPENDFEQSADFLADGLIDSFDVVTLVAELDKRFGISIDGMEILPENFCNIKAIKRLLGEYGVVA
jgi:acyl carrier protein